MLGSFWHSKRDAGETTPKASSSSSANERNPFELSLGSSSGSSNTSSLRAGNHSRKNSAASTSSNVGSHAGIAASGLRTPTLQKSFVLPEVTSSVNAHGSHAYPSNATSAASSLHQSPMHTVSGSGRNTPTRSHHPVNPYPAPSSPKVPGMSAGGPTSSLGKSSAAAALTSQTPQPQTQQPPPPEFKLSQPPESRHGNSPKKDVASSAGASSSSSSSQGSSVNLPSSSTPNKISPSSTSGQAAKKKADTSYLKGKLTVKILEARGLSAPSPESRPYVVATFEQNEFVSREAINENEEDATGQPMTPETSSQLRKSQRGGPQALTSNGSETRKDDAMDTSTASAYSPVWKHEVAFDVTAENSPLTVCVYDRTTEIEAFLGLVDIEPRLIHNWTVDDWYKLHSRQDEPVTGEVRIRMRFEKSEARRTLRANDFEFLRMIGKGTFGRVFQVRKKDTKRIYAMKVLSKREIIAKKEVQHTIGERKILQRSSECPFLLGLKFSFQSETELFLVMDFKSGGELFHHLQREGRFTEDRARFYAAEITLAFEYLHKYHIVYRDLKPENILLDATGHIVLCDFGLSKPDLPSNALTNTFCGTTEYLAPEVLLDDHGYSQTVDFWSLGVLLFEMCCGWSPFYAEDTQQMYKNICFGKIKFPRGVIGDDGKQFVKGLLNRNPAHRLGSKRDAGELKEHPFFKMIDWEALAARQVTVPFKPFVDSDESVSNFDPEFTEADILKEAPIDAGNYYDDDPSSAWIDQTGGDGKARPAPVPINPSRDRMNGAGPGPLGEEAQDAFRGFSYSGDVELHDLMMAASVKEGHDEDDMRA